MHYNSGGIMAGTQVTVTNDSYLRRSTLEAIGGLNSVVPSATWATVSYAYDSTSRLYTVSNDIDASAAYSYASNSMSDLVSTVTLRRGPPVLASPLIAWTRNEHDKLDRLTWKSTQKLILGNPTTVHAAFTYTYNSLSQRTQATREDGNYWSYGYNTKGEVTSGQKKLSGGTGINGYAFGYTFDGIGNRTQTVRNGCTASYSANALNEYTSRDVPGTFDVVGEASASATVDVNGSTAGRQGSLFSATVSATNTSAAQHPLVTVTGTLSSSTDVTTGRQFLAKTPEEFTYDLDGNLKKDGRWDYEWDAENRLKAISARTDSTAGVPTTARIRVEYVYDAWSRRVQKRVFGWNSTTNAYKSTEDQIIRYAWDGWNIVAEVDAAGRAVDGSVGSGGGVLLRSYLWGKDMSGTLHGAGGVGGLISVRDELCRGSHFAVYDGNGNVVAMIDCGTGNMSAQYEYGPFGELIRETGWFSSRNVIRHSTKLWDSETQLSNYGYRMFNCGIGRWISRDPVGISGGVNNQSFFRNDLINGIDYAGLTSCDCNCRAGQPDMRSIINGHINDIIKRNGADLWKVWDELVPASNAIIDNTAMETWLYNNHSNELNNVPVFPLRAGYAACLKVCGHCIGTDKLGHFFEEGFVYKGIRDEKGRLKFAQGWGLWAEGKVPADPEVLNWIKSDTFPVFWSKGVDDRPLRDMFGDFGDKLLPTPVGMADLKANSAGMQFWDDLNRHGMNYKFDICKWVTSRWDEHLNPNQAADTNPLK